MYRELKKQIVKKTDTLKNIGEKSIDSGKHRDNGKKIDSGKNSGKNGWWKKKVKKIDNEKIEKKQRR